MNIIIYTLVVTHVTIACVTLYLHRSQTHRSVQFHPMVNHCMRAWLWLTTGMITREWVAIHRKHHQRSDQAGDPHSPQIHGIQRVLFGGALLYHSAGQDTEMIDALSRDCPNDWIERNLYSAHSRWGILVMLVIDCLLFGPWGLAVWGIQMIWIPFWAAGVVNGVGHWWGYRNTDTPDTSRNIIPWAVWIGGEELHNNHHAAGANAKFSHKWWEFDLGWMYIQILRFFKLATVR